MKYYNHVLFETGAKKRDSRGSLDRHYRESNCDKLNCVPIASHDIDPPWAGNLPCTLSMRLANLIGARLDSCLFIIPARLSAGNVLAFHSTGIIEAPWYTCHDNHDFQSPFPFERRSRNTGRPAKLYPISAITLTYPAENTQCEHPDLIIEGSRRMSKERREFRPIPRLLLVPDNVLLCEGRRRGVLLFGQIHLDPPRLLSGGGPIKLEHQSEGRNFEKVHRKDDLI